MANKVDITDLPAGEVANLEMDYGAGHLETISGRIYWVIEEGE